MAQAPELASERSGRYYNCLLAPSTRKDGCVKESANPAQPTKDEERLQLAARTAERIISQCRAHAEAVVGKLSDRINNAATSTPCGQDIVAARAGSHKVALQERLDIVESMSNAVVSYLRGLEVLIKNEIFYALSTVPIIRSLAEVAATCHWMLEPGLTTEDRAARGYASLFRTVEQSKARMEDPAKARELLVQIVTDSGGKVQRRVSEGVTTDEVGTVRVGRSHARVAFKYQHRLQQQIPSISTMYSGMSAMIHGEGAAIGLAWDSADVLFRMVAKVALESTRAWSDAVNTWTGTEYRGPFVNETDQANIINSMPPEQVAEFKAELRRAQQGS